MADGCDNDLAAGDGGGLLEDRLGIPGAICVHGYSSGPSWPALYRELRPAKGVRTGLLRATIGLELIIVEGVLR